jgi:hypothetical protein
VLLPYDIGYWPGEANADAFYAAALAYADWFVAEDLPVDWIVVDMEMNVNTIYEIGDLFMNGEYLAALQLLWANRTPERYAQAVATYQACVEELHARGLYAMVVTYPTVLDDLPDGDPDLQDLLETPTAGIDWDEVSTMVYSTTYAQYLGTPMTPYLVYDYARSTVDWFGGRASIALGVSGEMTDPAVLAAEVAAAKAAGVERIQVYSYAGSISHGDPDAWHAVFEAEPVVPPPDVVTPLLRGALRLGDALLGE